MKTYESRKVETTIRHELSTEDIEEILRERLELSSDADFNWHIGQRVSLSISEIKEEIEPLTVKF